MNEIYEFLPLDSNNPSSSFNLVMLHGYGSDGFDLLHVGDLWQKKIPNLSVYSLQAPTPCQDVPSGRQWFYIKDLEPYFLYKETKKSSDYLVRSLLYLSSITKVPIEKTILMGFSQGAMMALYTGIYQLPQIRGILAYSGSLFCYDSPPTTAKNTKICLIYGNEDTVVPLSLFEISSKKFKEEGLELEEHLITGLAHSINNQALLAGESFLKKLLSI